MKTLGFRPSNSAATPATDKAPLRPCPHASWPAIASCFLACFAATSAAQSGVNWNIQMTNAVVLADPGTVVIFGGVITNASGTNLVLRNASVFLDPSGPSTNWQVRLAEAFLATRLLLPSTGYRGPLFEVVVPVDATNRPPVSGRMELALDRAVLPVFNSVSPVIAPATLNVGFLINPPALQIAVAGDSLQLSWPSAAGTYRLETVTNLPANVAWSTITNRPSTLNFKNWLIVTNASLQGFFRLKLETGFNQ